MCTLLSWIPLGTFLVATVTAIVGLRTYSRKVAYDRIERVAALYRSFYESELYAIIRRKLDHHPPLLAEQLDAMMADTAAGGDADKVFDYLNFFEFLAYLWSSQQLNFNDVDGLFGYYVNAIARGPLKTLVETKHWSYEHLGKLLEEWKRKHPEASWRNSLRTEH